MQVFQILDGRLYYKTKYKTLAETVGLYAPDIRFVEISDSSKAREGWIYNEITGDITPPPCPVGWGYDEKTGTFYNLEEAKQAAVYAEICQYKQQLSATDYKIIKCSESQLAGLEAPYDIAVLHAERQALRNEINLLEAEQNSLK